MKAGKRTKLYQRSHTLEDAIESINGLLGPVEDALLNGPGPLHAPIFIMGCARSGSTLLLQLLAATKNLAYPSNFMSRFYKAPVLAAKMQRMLGDLDPKHEVFEKDWQLTSDLGKTKGALAPHEFWYFWRRFYRFEEIQILSKSGLAEVDTDLFCKEIAGITAVFDKPLCLKGMILNWHIDHLVRILPNAQFIFLERDPIHNAGSLLRAREKFFGDRNTWYSFKPPEYVNLKELPPAEQVAAQVHFTNKAIRQGMNAVPNEQKVHLLYEDLCKDPKGTVKKVLDQFGIKCSSSTFNTIPDQLPNVNNIPISNEDRSTIDLKLKELNAAIS